MNWTTPNITVPTTADPSTPFCMQLIHRIYPEAIRVLHNRAISLFLCHLGEGEPFCVADANAGHGPIAAGLRDGVSILHTLAAANKTVYHLVWHGCALEDTFKSYDYLVEQMALAFDAISSGPINAVGLCQGGPVLLRYAARYPERVSRIVTVAAPLSMSDCTGSVIEDAIGVPIWAYSAAVGMMGGAMSCQSMVDTWNNHKREEHARDRKNPDNKALYDWFDQPNTDAQGRSGRIGHWIFDAVWAMKQDSIYRNEIYDRGEHIDLMRIKHIPQAFVGGLTDEVCTITMAHPKGACWVNEQAQFIEVPGGHVGSFAGRGSQLGIAKACGLL